MFKFGLGQRVNVPTYSNVQGIVQHRVDSLIDPIKYGLSWLVGMQVNSLFFTEEEMAAANKPPAEPAPAPTVATLTINVDKSQVTSALKDVRKLRAAMKRKPAKKKSAKRKR